MLVLSASVAVTSCSHDHSYCFSSGSIMLPCRHISSKAVGGNAGMGPMAVVRRFDVNLSRNKTWTSEEKEEERGMCGGGQEV